MFLIVVAINKKNSAANHSPRSFFRFIHRDVHKTSRCVFLLSDELLAVPDIDAGGGLAHAAAAEVVDDIGCL